MHIKTKELPKSILKSLNLNSQALTQKEVIKYWV
jgi:hypothetical protein